MGWRENDCAGLRRIAPELRSPSEWISRRPTKKTICHLDAMGSASQMAGADMPSKVDIGTFGLSGMPQRRPYSCTM